MKKFAIVATLVTATLSTASIFAADGQINFTGNIIDNACTPTNNMTVNMGSVASTAFNGTGSTSSPTKITISLTNCPAAVTSASVKFDGVADSNDSNLLQLTKGTGVATGVGIQLSDKDGVLIPLFTSSSAYPLVAGANNLDFVARYQATAATVTAGPANSTSSFTINYN